jgi:hypothetical protein
MQKRELRGWWLNKYSNLELCKHQVFSNNLSPIPTEVIKELRVSESRSHNLI